MIRLQKYLAERGLASRRGAEEMIKQGRITINGRRAEIGMSIDPATALVAVDGQALPPQREQKITLMLHKPRGYVTTMHDRHATKTVADLVDCPERLYPVGRLDKDSEGLLLMTNDGELAHALTHPSRQVAKVYRVTLRGQVSENMRTQLQTGIMLDGTRTLPLQLREVSQQPDRTVLEFTLQEGRNRQIRRMCQAVGLQVLRLKRTQIGPLKLGMLPVGETRTLTAEETKKLLLFLQKK
ncbi:MAG: rRNA pseudouridine synthase [Oscillospiraceae bacterium]|nr:rRNA pseudouridine synthase [Oscillospiraceae bacterium]